MKGRIQALYYGGLVKFNKDITVHNSAGNYTEYKNKQEVYITPSLLHLIEMEKVPLDSFKMVLRQLRQLEDKEILELSEVVAPRQGSTHLRKVMRQGAGKAYTIEVELHKDKGQEKSMVINSQCNIAISDILYMPHGSPVVTQMAAPNQPAALKWLILRHIDVFGLIPKEQAISRKKWNAKGYVQ